MFSDARIFIIIYYPDIFVLHDTAVNLKIKYNINNFNVRYFICVS